MTKFWSLGNKYGCGEGEGMYSSAFLFLVGLNMDVMAGL